MHRVTICMILIIVIISFQLITICVLIIISIKLNAVLLLLFFTKLSILYGTWFGGNLLFYSCY